MKSTPQQQNTTAPLSPPSPTTTSHPTPRSRLPHLPASSHFTIFWLGQSLSFLGDGFALIALPLLVLQATGSVLQMGAITATFGAAQLLTGLFSGSLVDRFDRRLLMIVCDCARLLLYASLPLVWLLSGPCLWLLYLVTALASAFSNLFDVAFSTAVPNLVERDRYTWANGRLRAAMSVAFLIGPSLAGLVCARFGPVSAMGIDALSFACSALTLFVIRWRRTPSSASASPHSSWWQRVSAGARFVWQEPTLRTMLLFLVLIIVAEQSTNDLLIYYIQHVLRLGDVSVGLFFGFNSVGAFAGGMLASWLRRRLGFGWCYLGGIGCIGVGTILVMLVPPLLPLYLLLGPGITFGYTINGIGTSSLRQEVTPDEVLGRVSAVYLTTALALGPLGALVGAAVAARVGVVPVMLVIGGLLVAAALVGRWTPVAAHTPSSTQ